MAAVEDAGYQFLKDGSGWALYDLDDRSAVRNTRHKMLGDSVWAAVEQLGVDVSGDEAPSPRLDLRTTQKENKYG